MTRGGVGYVDLSGEASSGLPGGSLAEQLTVYSIVNTVVTNFPAASRVQILVNDSVVPSLGGHIDVGRPLPPDMTLVAVPAPDSPASPAPPGSTPASPAAGAPAATAVPPR